MKDRYVKEEYNESVMSDELKMRILKTCENLESLDERDSIKVSNKKGLLIAVATMAAVLMFTLGVSAAKDWEYLEVFRKIFGDSVDNVADIYSYPEVDVMVNTFEDLEIEVKGVVATKNSLYVLFDFVALDGTIFDTTDIHEGSIYVTSLGNEVNLHNPNRYSNHFFDFNIESKDRIKLNEMAGHGINGFVLFDGGASVLDIYDGNDFDNRMSIAYCETLNICDYPGSVVVLSINSISKDGKIIKEGVWKAKFTVPEQELKVINLDVNKKTKMLRNMVFDYTSGDEYIYDEVEINNVTIDALSFQFTFTAHRGYLTTHTFHVWLEMKDGSIVGYPDIYESAYKGAMQGCGTQRGKSGVVKIILNEPINPDDIKAIHMGTDLVIELD
jgi:hypothetical protein